MATDSIMGLFQTPEQYQQALYQQNLDRNIALSKLDPRQRNVAMFGTSLDQLGSQVGRALGGEDPALVAASLRKQLAQGKDLTSSAGWAEYAKALQEKGDLQGAAMAAQKSTEIQSGAEFKQAKLEQASMLAKERDAAAMERLQERLRAEERMNMDTNQTRAMIAQLAAAMKGSQPKALPASLQKSEDKDLELIDNYSSQIEALAPSIQVLTPDSKGVAKLELGPLKNAAYMAKNAAGNSDETSRAYAALKSAVDTAVNLKVSAEKGVQTDKDVLRFANALIAAYGRNDTKATLEALQNYRDAMAKDQSKVKARLESRRRSQGVNPYYVEDTSTGGDNDPLGIRKK